MEARLGAAQTSAGPLHVLRPRRVAATPRPETPEADAVDDQEEACHQAALMMQRVIRGRAVQCLMYEGRTRASELTEELKTTHGLQKEDKIRIAREEAKAREYNALRTQAEQKDDAISALVDELCGGAVSAALDFLEKELRRLKEERRQRAYVLVALREKSMREAAEAGRRQRETRRRQEHDEMFKQVLGVTQETVDAYLHEIIEEGVALAAEEDAVRAAQTQAERIQESLKEHDSWSTAEQNELVAELVQQFLLPEVHKTAARHHIAAVQKAKLESARKTIFGLLDDAEIKEGFCTQCGSPLDELCRCTKCPFKQEPVETHSRKDPRWKYTRLRPRSPEKTISQRFPPLVDIRRMVETIVDEAVLSSRSHVSERDATWLEWGRRVRERAEATLDAREFVEEMETIVDEAVLSSRSHVSERDATWLEWGRRVRERAEATLDAKEFVEEMFDRATGAWTPPPRVGHWHHYSARVIEEAIERSVPFERHDQCSKELPSAIRQRAQEQAFLDDPTCRCVVTDDDDDKNGIPEPEEGAMLLPSQVRILEEMRRCKCDTSPTPSPDVFPELISDDTDAATDSSPVEDPAQDNV